MIYYYNSNIYNIFSHLWHSVNELDLIFCITGRRIRSKNKNKNKSKNKNKNKKRDGEYKLHITCRTRTLKKLEH